MCQRTMSVALLEFVSYPQNRLGTHLCAKVSVEGRWSATLETIEDRQVYQQLQCNEEERGENMLLFIFSIFDHVKRPAACVRGRSYDSRKCLCPPLSTG